MKNPKLIDIIEAGKTYHIPTYIVTNEGIADGEGLELKMCKGSTNDESIPRQEGVFVESMLQMVVEHLTAVNVGDLSSRETSIAITKIQEALMWLGKRAEDRKLRNVQGTYQK